MVRPDTGAPDPIEKKRLAAGLDATLGEILGGVLKKPVGPASEAAPEIEREGGVLLDREDALDALLRNLRRRREEEMK